MTSLVGVYMSKVLSLIKKVHVGSFKKAIIRNIQVCLLRVYFLVFFLRVPTCDVIKVCSIVWRRFLGSRGFRDIPRSPGHQLSTDRTSRSGASPGRPQNTSGDCDVTRTAKIQRWNRYPLTYQSGILSLIRSDICACCKKVFISKSKFAILYYMFVCHKVCVKIMGISCIKSVV